MGKDTQLKLFVGSNDSTELKRMADESRREGFVILRQRGYLMQILDLVNPWVEVAIVRGGLAEICIPKVGIQCNTCGVGVVRFDLQHIRMLDEAVANRSFGDLDVRKRRIEYVIEKDSSLRINPGELEYIYS